MNIYNQVRKVLQSLDDLESAKFSELYRRLKPPLSSVDQAKIKASLIGNSLVREGETYGTEPYYSLSGRGSELLTAMDLELRMKGSIS